MIVGTAGHIDHGKTALVRALTGVDTDRLPEEKRRGITIDLGFAPLSLPGVGVAGVVDVPGHEAFVRTMLAGATGIDVALLVVAADESVMPQTREHVAILQLLGVESGVVALTKRDLVDDDWLELVRADVAELLGGTAFEAAPVVPTSIPSGEGIEELRATLARVVVRSRARDDGDLFRMPIDRVFTVKGTGTVVTGTVWSGLAVPDSTVHILPLRRPARVRAIQTHGAVAERVGPGSRAAIALAGVDHTILERGMVLVGSDAWRPTSLMRGDVSLLGGTVASLRPRTSVRLHLGTSEVGARIVAQGTPLSGGEVRSARVVLDAPIVARAGDRFVLRGLSPLTTIGGGVVSDPLPPHRRARPWPTSLEPAAKLHAMLEEARGDGVDRDELPVRLGLTPRALQKLVAAASSSIVEIGRRLFLRDVLKETTSSAVDDVRAYHEGHPLEPGAPLQAIRAALPVRPELAEASIQAAVSASALEIDSGLVRLAGWTPRLTIGQEATLRELRSRIANAGAEPPSVTELTNGHGTTVSALLRILEREGVVVLVEGDRYYATAAVDDLIARLRAGMISGREYSPAELRDILGVSRKYLIPFLEYCDRRGITERRSAGRVLHGT